MWIFGYGSLVWKVDFPYVQKVIGYIKGYERKFWQASIDHRGVPEKPGRVVTLVPSLDPEAKVWGSAYKIHEDDIQRVLQHLDHREIMGYEKVPIDFYPIPNHPQNILVPSSSPPLDCDNIVNQQMRNESNCDTDTDTSSTLDKAESAYYSGEESEDSPPTNEGFIKCSEITTISKEYPPCPTDSKSTVEDVNKLKDISQCHPFTVTMYYGSLQNEHYIGPASLEAMSQQIFESIGPSGKNKDYLFNLAEAMRQICEEALDSHLAELEIAVRDLDAVFNLCSSAEVQMEL